MDKKTAASPGSLIDWAALSALYDHRQSFIDKLLRVAHASLADTPPAIRHAAARGDLQELAFIAHGLKGSACNLEVPRLLELAGHIERVARCGDVAALARAEQLALLVEGLRAELAAHLTPPKPGA